MKSADTLLRRKSVLGSDHMRCKSNVSNCGRLCGSPWVLQTASARNEASNLKGLKIQMKNVGYYLYSSHDTRAGIWHERYAVARIHCYSWVTKWSSRDQRCRQSSSFPGNQQIYASTSLCFYKSEHLTHKLDTGVFWFIARPTVFWNIITLMTCNKHPWNLHFHTEKNGVYRCIGKL